MPTPTHLRSTRAGVPAVRARSLAPASLRLVHDTLAITLSLSHPRSDVPTLPFMRGSPTRVALRSAPPRPHTLRATPPLSARARPSFRVPPRAPLLWARRETREGWGTARRGLGWRTDPLIPGAGGGGGRADSPPCVRGRLAGVARAEEDWAVRAVPPLARVGGAGRAVRPLAYAGRAGRGLGWRGPRGGGGAPSLLSLCGRGGAGRGGAGRVGLGKASPAPKGTGVGTLSSVRGQGGAGATCPHAHPFRANGAARTGERRRVLLPRRQGGWGEGRGRRAAGPRERGGSVRHGGRARAPLICVRMGRQRSMRREEGVGATYPRVPPFRANRAARTGGGSRELPLCVRTGRRAASTFRREWGRRGEGSGRRGEERRGGRWGGRPTLFALCRAYRQKQGVPATYANVAGTPCFRHRVQNWTNWVCERRTPTPPPTPPSSPLLSSPLLSSRSPPLAYPTRVEKWTQRAGPFARREGAHGSRPLSAPPYSRETGAHEDEGRAGPSPVSDRPTTFARARRPPAPPFPPTALSARKEDTSPLPCPRRPVRAERDSVPTPVPFGAGDACPAPRAPPRPAPPRPARIARGGTVRHPLRAGHASPTPAPPCQRTQEDGRRVQPRPRAQGEGRRAQPSPPRRGPRQPAARARKGESRRVHPLLRLLRTPPRPRTPGDKRVGAPAQPPPRGTPALPGFTPRPEKRCLQGGGPHARTHARGYTERGTSASGERRSRAKGVRARRGGAERNPGGGAAHERKGGHIGARVRK
ncbi:hypothetical protein EDB84DRAFT_1679406 [Lactarius hengduanensis]|nr:hypothetical protein EDB84DRAFT_1679406 [Lactarius hengduanensis]